MIYCCNFPFTSFEMIHLLCKAVVFGTTGSFNQREKGLFIVYCSINHITSVIIASDVKGKSKSPLHTLKSSPKFL